MGKEYSIIGNIYEVLKRYGEKKNIKQTDHYEDLNEGEKITEKYISRKQIIGMWVGFTWLWIEVSGGVVAKTAVKHRVPLKASPWD
jgi:hypothetical protein